MARFVCTPRPAVPVHLPDGRPLGPGERLDRPARDVRDLVDAGLLVQRPARRAVTTSTPPVLPSGDEAPTDTPEDR
ncbi:MAG: hypothetical protein M0P31_15425 [Solirubrobacteraceae bacterium]|nr:hypothetical protein [Solirubrobacteraceae bacterium]